MAKKFVPKKQMVLVAILGDGSKAYANSKNLQVILEEDIVNAHVFDERDNITMKERY